MLWFCLTIEDDLFKIYWNRVTDMLILVGGHMEKVLGSCALLKISMTLIRMNSMRLEHMFEELMDEMRNEIRNAFNGLRRDPEIED